MNLNQTLQKRGIAVCNNIFTDSEIKFLREKFIENCGSSEQGDDRRYGGKGGTVKCKYLDLKDIYEKGLLEKIINPSLHNAFYMDRKTFFKQSEVIYK